MEQRLSDFLLEKVDLYATDGASLPSKEDETARFYLQKIAKRLIESRESFTDDEFFLLDQGSDRVRLDLERGPRTTQRYLKLRLIGCSLAGL